MDPWLQAYEDKKKRLKMPFESNTKVLQGPCLAKMPDFGDQVRDAIAKAKEDGCFMNEDVSDITSIKFVVHPSFALIL